ncbi:MAG TPA: hypothetical protein VMT56_03080 [Candidatus Bathyarchaeia archaeon]|nr:hypothetical protein [Candidatus Bathyarchaeia archaeon]
MKMSAAASCLLIFLVATVSCTLAQVNTDNGCRTGGKVLAKAYVLMNPMYAYFYGDLESYIEENSEHFRPGGDSIRCAKALSKAFANTAFAVFDPNEMKEQQAMRDQLNAQLGSVGLSPEYGNTSPTLSSQYYNVSLLLARMARTLPAASQGDYEPLNTPMDDTEAMQIWAANTLKALLQDPTVQWAFRQQEELVREVAKADYSTIVMAAKQLADSPPSAVK